MNKLVFYAGLFLASFMSPSFLHAQDWVSKMQDPNVNFFEVQKTFNDYYAKKERVMEREMKRASKRKGQVEEENEFEIPGYNQFKRWEWFMAPRVDQNGNRFDPSAAWRESKNYRKQYQNFSAGNWTIIGPVSSPPSSGGAGRLNFVRIDPNNSFSIFVGSPGGGLWHSTDGGITWSTNTDFLPHVIGCTDLAIDPTNSDIMYLATGDGDGGDTYSVGWVNC